MNKGIWLLSLLLSFSAFAQFKSNEDFAKAMIAQFKSNEDFAKAMIAKCKEWGGLHNYDESSLDTKVVDKRIQQCAKVSCSISTANAKNISVSEFKSTFKNYDDTKAGMFGHVVSCLDKGASSTGEEFIEVATGTNTSTSGLDLSVIIAACKSGNCPDGYNLNFDTGILTGPNGLSININTVSTGNNGDSDIAVGDTSIRVDGRCPAVGCWYQGKQVSFDGLLNSCFKKLKIKKIGKFLGIFNKKNTGKYRIKYKVLKGCEGAYSAVVDDLTGAISISGSGKGHVGKGQSQSQNQKVIYVKGDKGSKGQTQDQSSKGNKGDIDGEFVFVMDEDDDINIKGNGSLKFVFKNGEKCTYTTTWKECLDSEYDKIVSINGDILHCINCEGPNRRRGSSDGGLGSWGRSAGGVLNGIGNIVGGIAPGLFGWLSSKEYAGAAKYGFEQCRGMQNDYQTNAYNYIQDNEVPDRDVTVPGCNGYQMGGFAGGLGFQGNGLGGFGNPWTGGGYTGGFIGGMGGPYGQFSPFGNQFGNQFGGLNGGVGIGISGLGGLLGGGGNQGWANQGGWLGTPGFGGGQFGGNGFGGQFGGGLNGFGNGIVPWGQNGGGFNGGFNGGWGQQGQGGWGQGQNWGAINQSYQANQQASAQGSFYQQQALAGQVQNAGQNYYQYGANSNYGYSPGYAPGNLGLNLNFNGGLGW